MQQWVDLQGTALREASVRAHSGCDRITGMRRDWCLAGVKDGEEGVCGYKRGALGHLE